MSEEESKMKILLVYDDTVRKSEVIVDIIGEKGFADVVVKKRKLEEYYRENMEHLYPNLIWRKIHSIFEYQDILKELEVYRNEEIRVLHCFSNYLIADTEKALLAFQKLNFVEQPYGVMDGNKAVGIMFPDTKGYGLFCRDVISGKARAWDLAKNQTYCFGIEGMVDIGIIGNFIQCITGNFDSRYFNSLQGNKYTIVKSSVNKEKIKKEYYYYHLLPDDMKFWFVMPFHYREDGETASYTMERLHMTDLAIKWVHGSMGEDEFEELMDKYFYFFSSRHSKACEKEEYERVSKILYVDKVQQRIRDLKELAEYQKIEKLLKASGECSVDSLAETYFKLKEKIEAVREYPYVSVIGHGDPCFANSMYNKSTKTLKFIDPKGALTEDDLWTNPYYDIAKLSHSVCGRYDFFNNALYDIQIGSDFEYNLKIPFDNSMYIDVFRKKVIQYGFDYLTVRIYEVSLFLSMLPLHIDNPHKVFGFILNAKNILKEIEKYV